MKESKDDSSVKMGRREGVRKRDIHLYNAIKNYGLSMKFIAERFFNESSKNSAVKFYQILYDFRDISDEDLERLRKCVNEIISEIRYELAESQKITDRKRKIEMLLNSGDEEKIDKLLKGLDD